MSRRLRAAAALAAALVLAPAPVRAVCAPAATGIFPASGIAPASLVATISGTGLDAGTVTVLGEPGLVATVQSTSDTQLSVRLDLDAAAVPGERLLFVDTAGGTTGVSFTINAPGGPLVNAVSPPLIATLGVPLDVVITGANLSTVTAASFVVSGIGVAVASATPSPDGTTLAVAFTVDAAADVGTHAVTLATAGGSVVLQLYVQRPPPTLTAVHPAAAELGATVPLTLTGTNLTGAALVITTPPGATTGDVAITDVATSDDGTLTATVAVSPTAELSIEEPRLLIVTTESGQTTAEFFVLVPDLPAVTGIEPGAGEPGGPAVPVTLRGLNFTGLVDVTTPVPDPDVTPQNVQLVDDETVTLEVQITGGAATGTTGVDHTLRVTTAAGTADTIFRVIPPGQPFIGAIRPPFANRGATFTMFVDGVNLSLLVPGTGVDIDHPQIAESNAAAVDDRTARVTMAVGEFANAGNRRAVTVNLTNGKSYTKGAAFRVNVPGQLPTITDVSPGLVPVGATTPMTVTGTNFEGGAVLVTGPGATVTNTVVDPTGTLITFDLTIAPDAPAENRAVIVVTENGTARCGIATDPTPPAFLPAKLVKTGALFLVPDAGFRLFVFEFSVSPLFPAGLRTWAIGDADGSLILSRLDAQNVGRAFRERHRGWVRVRAVTATNRLAVTAGTAIRR